MGGNEEKENANQWMSSIMMLQVVAIQMRQLRGLHAGKVAELNDKLKILGVFAAKD